MIKANLKVLRRYYQRVQARGKLGENHLNKVETTIENGTPNANSLDILVSIQGEVKLNCDAAQTILDAPFQVGLNLEEVTVIPDVSGMNEASASSAMTTARLLSVEFKRVFDDTISLGDVVAQSPPPGGPAETDVQIKIFISDGPEV